VGGLAVALKSLEDHGVIVRRESDYFDGDNFARSWIAAYVYACQTPITRLAPPKTAENHFSERRLTTGKVLVFSAHSGEINSRSASIIGWKGDPMTAEQLGEIRRDFRPGFENLVAGIIIGLLMIAGGCAAVFFPTFALIESGGSVPVWTEKGQKGWSWGAAGIFAVIGVGLVIGGIFLIRWVRSLFSFRLRVGQNGFAVSEKKAMRVVGWDDIVSVQEIHLYERPPLLKGVAKYALPKTMSRSFVLIAKQGDPVAFDGNTIKGHSKLAKMIQEETSRRNIPWEIVEKQGY
jgi:hypothetical protein